ncbi:MAG: glutathione synthase [Rhodospirillales bacterium]|nr:glutathione synthase [Rhodospirillales bacterium]
MPITVAIQMDPVDSIDIDGDSTFVLGLEAQKRGHKLYHYLPQDLTFKDGVLTAFARPLELRREKGNHFTIGEGTWINLKTDVDVILMRQDPPFDMAYITATHLLEHIEPDTLVVNNPANVRNAPEKLFVTHFEGLMPPTMISSNAESIEAFRTEHKDIILKPLYGNGGAGVFHLKPGDDNLNSLLEMFTELYREPIMVQAFLPDVRAGDKRIILVDGKPAGAVNRIPKEGEARSNLHVGGKAAKTELTPREQEICAAIGPALKEQGLIFVGIDVIGDYLTEINVTSPTGLQEINRFNGSCLEAEIWDAIEGRL